MKQPRILLKGEDGVEKGVYDIYPLVWQDGKMLFIMVDLKEEVEDECFVNMCLDGEIFRNKYGKLVGQIIEE
jgi:hypothetical protein